MKKLFLILPLVLIILTACPSKKDSIDNTNQYKIGYLFYTDFIDQFNPQLNEAFARFKAAGVTDLIIDLRYNHGGSLAAASQLASLIAPISVVNSKQIFTRLDFNSFLNSIYSPTGDNEIKLGIDYTNIQEPPLNLAANLNLKTVYIIATSDSYSASELLTFCLRPYMKVVHIGEGTGGKFTASQTITPYDNYGGRTRKLYDVLTLSQGAKDSLKNWGMQPIMAIYKDSKNNDFSTQGKLIPDVPVTSRENDRTAYKLIGDLSDYLLNTAILKITGVSSVSAAQEETSPRSVYSFPLTNQRLYSSIDNLIKESVRLPSNLRVESSLRTNQINRVSQFVYDGMSLYYKWADNSVKGKPPTVNDNDPVQYFKSLLYPLDTQNGWSWITNDVEGLLNSFSGTPVDFGWALAIYRRSDDPSKVVGIIQYVFPNTPASNAGLKRGDMITQIGGADIDIITGSSSNYLNLFGSDPINITVRDQKDNTKSVLLSPVTITTNPILKDTVYIIKKQ